MEGSGRLVIAILALAAGGGLVGYRYWSGHHSKRDVVTQLTFGDSIADIAYQGVHYQGTWSPDTKTFGGKVQWAGRVSADALPMLTHEVLVTTGDYSDPGFVTIQPIVDHHTSWRFSSNRPPQGTIFIVHCLPATPEVYDALDAVKVGDEVQIEGELLTGPILIPGYIAWQTFKSSHPTVFVRSVTPLAAAATP